MLTVCLGLRCREFAIPIHGSTQSKLALTNGDTVRCYPVPTPRLCRSTTPITHLWYCEGRGQEDGLAWPQACWDSAKPRPLAWSSAPDTQPYWRRGRFYWEFPQPRG